MSTCESEIIRPCCFSLAVSPLRLNALRKKGWNSRNNFGSKLCTEAPGAINFKFFCSLSRNISSHSIENLAFHSLLRWNMTVLPILTTSLIHFSRWFVGKCTFWALEWDVQSGWRKRGLITCVNAGQTCVVWSFPGDFFRDCIGIDWTNGPLHLIAGLWN